MKKTINFLLVLFTVTSFVACSSSEEYVSSYRIKEVFPGMRLDSVTSRNQTDMNFKLKYIGDKLVEYGEYLENGEVHKSRLFKLDWKKNRIDIYNGVREELMCYAIVGDNQFVKECYDPEGNLLYVFTYDTDGHLIHYNTDPMSYESPDYNVLKWENGNLISFEEHYGGVLYSEYSEFMHENAGGIAHLGSRLGTSAYGEFLNSLMHISALYYAGMLGLGTEYYPSSYRWRRSGGKWSGGSLGVTTKNGYVIGSEGQKFMYINTEK